MRRRNQWSSERRIISFVSRRSELVGHSDTNYARWQGQVLEQYRGRRGCAVGSDAQGGVCIEQILGEERYVPGVPPNPEACGQNVYCPTAVVYQGVKVCIWWARTFMAAVFWLVQ